MLWCVALGVALAVHHVAAQSDDDIANAAAAIWAADDNRFPPGDIIYNINGPILFEYVNDGRFGTPTYKFFRDLRLHYNPELGIPESCGAQCESDKSEFLIAISNTGPIQQVWQILLGYGLAPPTMDEFMDEISHYWFTYYTRTSGPLDSSGFEHVFFGEVRPSEVTGFHNWIAAYEEEKIGAWIYGSHQNTCDPETLRLSFNWLTYEKPITSFFMYTSPEVELAIYHLCFMTRRNQACRVTLDGHSQTITNYDILRENTIYVGTAYPTC